MYILLLHDEVLSQVLKHLGDVRKGGLVLHLEGNGVKELLSHQAVLKGLELGVHGHVGVGSGSLNEDGVDGDQSQKNEDELGHLLLLIFTRRSHS